MLAINADSAAAFELLSPMPAGRYGLSAADLMGTSVNLTGRELKLGSGDALPEMTGQPAPTGKIRLAPASNTFLAYPSAANPNCR